MISEAIVENSEYWEKEDRWDYAIGLATIEGGEPSDFFLELVEREKRGELSTEDIRKEVIRRFKEN
ncbi:MAG: antitoxin VbhA family protein [Lachnospiraceae bacterium]|jgi:hypothetical protein|nr:antitoxin VbhA family protein [Lachnospiraceae bacterium]